MVIKVVIIMLTAFTLSLFMTIMHGKIYAVLPQVKVNLSEKATSCLKDCCKKAGGGWNGTCSVSNYNDYRSCSKTCIFSKGTSDVKSSEQKIEHTIEGTFLKIKNRADEGGIVTLFVVIGLVILIKKGYEKIEKQF